MEIAIWTTVLTTIITFIQTWAMWYFSKRVKLEDSEMDELVDKLEDEDDPNFATEDLLATQLNVIGDWVESELGDHWEAIKATNSSSSKLVKRIGGLQELVDGLLDAMEGLYTCIDELEAREAYRDDQAKKAAEVLNTSLNRGTNMSEIEESDEVHEIEESDEVQEIESTSLKAHQSHHARKRTPRTLTGIHQKASMAAAEIKAREEGPQVEEAPLKDPRSDDDPLITDLRAESFREEPVTLDGIYDLPTFGDGYEAWGASSGRQPRSRGFRRI